MLLTLVDAFKLKQFAEIAFGAVADVDEVSLYETFWWR